MSAAKALKARLSEAPAVTALTATRITSQIAQQDGRTFPQITYEVTNEEVSRNYTGSSGLSRDQAEIACAATSYAGSVELGKAVKVALDNGSGTWGGIKVLNCMYRSSTEQQESNGQGQDALVFTVTLTFTLWTVG